MRITLLILLLITVSPFALAEKRGANKNMVIPLPININQADAQVLSLALDGIGERKAQAIVEYRELNGPFQAVEDLAQVKGIGRGTLQRNEGRMSVD